MLDRMIRYGELDTEHGSLEYKVSENGVHITGYQGKDSEIDVHDMIYG